MGTRKILFVWPHNKVGEFIDHMQGPGDDPSHVAVYALGGLLEAVEQGGATLLPIERFNAVTRGSAPKFSCASRHAVALTCAFGLVSIARMRPFRSVRLSVDASSLTACLCCTRQIRPK